MNRRSNFLINGGNREKDHLVSFGGDDNGFVYVYELKEKHLYRDIIEEGIEGVPGSEERITNSKYALIRWISRTFHTEPFEL